MQVTASKKAERQQAVLKIVHERPIATQVELKQLLKERGIEVDQATLSRDIRELGLVKTPADGGGFRYAPVEEVSPVVHTRSSKLVAHLVKTIDWSGNLLVLKTHPGDASPVGLALDRLGWPEIVGTVAGDDTLMVVLREGVPAKRVAKRLKELRER